MSGKKIVADPFARISVGRKLKRCAQEQRTETRQRTENRNGRSRKCGAAVESYRLGARLLRNRDGHFVITGERAVVRETAQHVGARLRERGAHRHLAVGRHVRRNPDGCPGSSDRRCLVRGGFEEA